MTLKPGTVWVAPPRCAGRRTGAGCRRRSSPSSRGASGRRPAAGCSTCQAVRVRSSHQPLTLFTACQGTNHCSGGQRRRVAMIRSPGAPDGVVDLGVLVVADLAAGRVVQARVRALRAALEQQLPQGQPHLIGSRRSLSNRLCAWPSPWFAAGVATAAADMPDAHR